MKQNEIRQHERYKQMALYCYDINNNKLPQGAKHLGNQKASEKYRGMNIKQMTDSQVDELLDELI